MRRKEVPQLIIILGMAGLFFVPSFSFADVIFLKSGKTVEGKIIEKNDEYVKMRVFGVDLKYYSDEIASVNKEHLKTTPAPSESGRIQIAVTTAESQPKIFRDEELGYSLVYPSSWQEMLPEERKRVMMMGLRPNQDSLVTIQLQVGTSSEADTKGKSTLADLVETFLKPNPELTREFIKPVTLRNESGYLIRYSAKTAEAIYGATGVEGALYVPVKITFDYYFFSPVFSSEGKDRRMFLIELSYVEFEGVSSEVDSARNRDNIYKWDSYYKEQNKKIEENFWAAREIINSFSFSNERI
jgi:hypothetical protein